MKKILISIKPKWVAKILNGEKTLEIRKSAPKDLPCEVYIYCTKDKILGNLIKVGSEKNSELFGKNAIIGINKGFMEEGDIDLRGKVVAKFTLNKVDEIENDKLWEIDNGFLGRTCLSFGELACYLSSKKGYAWHIDNLVTFDRPKELSDFNKPDVPTYEQSKPLIEMIRAPYTEKDYREDCKRLGYCITKAPQSWCYVEVDE